jgi:hypothetical protein
MKNTTLQLLAFLFLSSISITSCDMIEGISTGTVSIRFENISDIDLESVSAFGISLETLKAGELAEYVEVENVMLDVNGDPIFSLYSKINNVQFNDVPKKKCEMCGAGYHEDLEELKRGKYTLSIDLSQEYVEESDNSKLYFLTTFDKD